MKDPNRPAWMLAAPSDKELSTLADPFRPQRIKNSKAKGARNEHRSMVLLELAGYRCTRAAGSLGVWDIVAIGPTDIVLCQVKTRDWPGTVEMEALKGFRCPPNCKKLIHRYTDGTRMPEVREL